MEEKQPPKTFLNEEHSKDERTWGMFLHLSMLASFVIPLLGLLAPIVIWQMKKDQLPIIDEHGKNAVNWLISAAIYFAVGFVLWLLLIGIPIVIAVMICSVVFPIMAGIKANNGEVWKYPLTISFLQ